MFSTWTWIFLLLLVWFWIGFFEEWVLGIFEVFFWCCCFGFGFFLDFISSKEAQISFNVSGVLCFCGISSELSFSDTRAQSLH